MKAATRAASAGRGAALRATSSPAPYVRPRLPNGGRGGVGVGIKLQPEASIFSQTRTQAQPSRGRGSSLLQPHIQSSSQAPLPATGRGAGAGSGPQTGFSSAVLRGRPSAENSFNGSSMSRGMSRSQRAERSGTARRARDALWLADDVRELATDALARTRADADAFLKARRAQPFLKEIPFQGADFTAVVNTLPDQHWASLYIGEVTHALTANPSMQPAVKVALLNEALGALRSCAEGDHDDDDSRFQDAEEDAQSVAAVAAAQ